MDVLLINEILLAILFIIDSWGFEPFRMQAKYSRANQVSHGHLCNNQTVGNK